MPKCSKFEYIEIVWSAENHFRKTVGQLGPITYFVTLYIYFEFTRELALLQGIKNVSQPIFDQYRGAKAAVDFFFGGGWLVPEW